MRAKVIILPILTLTCFLRAKRIVHWNWSPQATQIIRHLLDLSFRPDFQACSFLKTHFSALGDATSSFFGTVGPDPLYSYVIFDLGHISASTYLRQSLCAK